MADWSLPQLSDLKVDVLSLLKGREVDAYTLAESPTNPPVGAKRYNHSLNIFQAWDGAAWVNLVVGIAGGGTGASDINGFLDNFNIGSMALQESNNVKISAGYIHGLGGGTPSNPMGLEVVTNAYLRGIVYAGSAPTTLTNSAGKILEGSIDNIGNFAHINQTEAITGTWTFNANVYTGRVNLYMGYNVQDTFIQKISIGEHAANNAPVVIQCGEGGYSTQTAVFAYNYHSPDGARVARINTSLGASFLRLFPDGAEIIGINSAGTTVPHLMVSRTINISYAPILQIANTNALAELRLAGAGGSDVTFYVDGGIYGAIRNRVGAVYFDGINFKWRNLAAGVLAGISSIGEFNALTLQTNNGWMYHHTGQYLLYANTNGVTQFFADTYYFTTSGNSYQIATLDSSHFILQPAAIQFTIGGAPGVGLRMYKSGASAFFCTHEAGGATNWYTANATERLMVLDSAPYGLYVDAGIRVPAGTASTAAIRWLDSNNSGIYFNGAGNGTAEFGAQFDSGHRSIVRAHLNSGGKIDFIAGDYIAFQIGAGEIRSMHTYPFTANNFYLGYSSLPWAQVWSLNGFTTTSDARMKDVHHDLIGVLNLIDKIQPKIASFKQALMPKEYKHPDKWAQSFPTFLAQDILLELDSKLGTCIVDNNEPESLGITYERLIPILWQAVKELHAKVKALEGDS